MCFANKVGRQHCLLSGSFRDIHFREVFLFHVVRVMFDKLVQVRHRSNIVFGASGLQQTRERLATTVCPAHLRSCDAMDILQVIDNFQPSVRRVRRAQEPRRTLPGVVRFGERRRRGGLRVDYLS